MAACSVLRVLQLRTVVASAVAASPTVRCWCLGRRTTTALVAPACTHSHRHHHPRCRRDVHTSTGDEMDPTTFKLDTGSPEFKSIFTPELDTLAGIFQRHGHQIRIAGGAVRDLLMGVQPHDLDFATPATPDQMKSMFASEQIRTINSKGESHGTVTARINDKANFEVTTLRVDLVTDGRHAKVDFTTSWQLDATRRDLTVNALFLGLDGTVYDYVDGLKDIEQRRVAFVGDPTKRIQEDYLRILRYFRFHGRISRDHDNHDKNTLEAIRECRDGLGRISGERVWSELRKILSGNNSVGLLMLMMGLELGPYMGLPENCLDRKEQLNIMWERASSFKPAPVTLLASLLRDESEVLHMHSRLRLSSFERDCCLFVVEHRQDKPSENRLRPYQTLILTAKCKQSDVREWVGEVLKYRGDGNLLKGLQEWQTPRFPVGGQALKEAGVPSGRAMTKVLQILKEDWIQSDFKLTEKELVQRIPDVVSSLEAKVVA